MGMKGWKRTVFQHSPKFMRKTLANMEAIRRNRIRRGGEYQRHYDGIDLQRILTEEQSEKKLESLNRLIAEARKNIPYFCGALPEVPLQSLDQLAELPLLTKEDLRVDLNRYNNPSPTLGVWQGTTGGTSGSLAFVRDLRSIHYEYALYDRLYDFAVGGQPLKKVRFSNAPIAKPETRTPPFWMEVAKMRQLQCSVYHLDRKSHEAYMQAIAEYGANLGTGYAFCWHWLAEEALARGDDRVKLQAVVSDGEGMTMEQKRMVEEAFSCRMFQTYGTSELGMVAVACDRGHYHIWDRAIVEVVDEAGQPVPDGVDGEIVITDLWSFDAPFIRYCPGDRGILRSSGCSCGWNGPYLETLTGRVRDYIVTSTGRKVNHIARLTEGIPGIRAFQNIQDEPGQLHIRVEVRADFDPKKMDRVYRNAKKLLGDMRITWEVVEKLEKAPSGKIKTTIRNF